MENRGRRGRRGRNFRHSPFVISEAQNPCPPKNSFLNGLYNIIILSSLMALIYLILEYHCITCASKCNVSNISKDIEAIANNLSYLNKNYHVLDLQISRISQDIPRLEGQIEILENFAKSFDTQDSEWKPKIHLPLPNVDVYLTKNIDGENVSCLASKTNDNNNTRSIQSIQRTD